VIVALFSDPEAYLVRYGEPDKARSGLSAGTDAWPVAYWDLDAAMAALLLLLAAVDLGLGACFLGNFRGAPELKAVLGVPEGRRYVGAVLIGRARADDPPTTSARRPRRPLQEVFHRSRWDR
jgi:nitroreductase